ncbi:cytochrome B, partial [Pseudomonas neuropathica]
PITVVLHWIVAFSLLSILCLQGFIAHASDQALRMEFIRLQNLIGLMLLQVSIYRFWPRVTAYHPMPEGTTKPIEVISSRYVAVAHALAMER